MNGVTWTMQEKMLLLDMWGKKSIDTIAETLGRSKFSIIGQANRQGLSDFKTKPWTVEEENELRALRNKGMGLARVARHMGRSYGSIKDKVKRLGADIPVRAVRTTHICSLLSSTANRLDLLDVDSDPEHPRAKPWVKRKYGECAFPVSQIGATVFSCCDPNEPGRNYCPHHCTVMYLPPEEMAQ